VWINGDMLAMFPRRSGPSLDPADAALEVTKRSEHDLLDLRAGDLIAFRFRKASYYCHNSLANIVVNGTFLESTAPGVNITYSRQYSDLWYDKSFLPEYGQTEDDPATSWLPLRKTTLVSNEAIVPGLDAWQPVDATHEDHRESNFYFRVQLPPYIL
jgi:hypothetical protein